MAKNSEDLRIRIVALHKDGFGYKKFCNTLTEQWPGSYRGFPRQVSLGTVLTRVDQRCWVLVLYVRCRSWLQKRETHECCQHCFRICRCWRSACQCSDHTPHSATSRFAWPSSQKEASSEAAGTEELRFVEGNMDSNMYCDILKQKMMPSLQKLFSIITTTPKTQPRWQLTYCWRWRWWSGQAWNLYPDLKPIEHIWGILKRKVEKHHVSNIQQLHDVIIYGVEEDAINNLCSSGEFHSHED